MAVELSKREKEAVSHARNQLGAKTEEVGGRIGRGKERGGDWMIIYFEFSRDHPLLSI